MASIETPLHSKRTSKGEDVNWKVEGRVKPVLGNGENMPGGIWKQSSQGVNWELVRWDEREQSSNAGPLENA